MKILILAFLNISLANKLSPIPEKLLLYQNVTGIDDEAVKKIFNDQSIGNKSNRFILESNFRIVWQYLSEISVYWYSTQWRHRSSQLGYRKTKCWCCRQWWRFLMLETWILSFYCEDVSCILFSKQNRHNFKSKFYASVCR